MHSAIISEVCLHVGLPAEYKSRSEGKRVAPEAPVNRQESLRWLLLRDGCTWPGTHVRQPPSQARRSPVKKMSMALAALIALACGDTEREQIRFHGG